MTAAPKISVIICSLNRPQRLEQCLQHLDMDSLIALSGEIVLVYTGDDTETAVVMNRFAAASPVPVKVIHVERRGISAARNEGIKASAGSLLIFTDDDCRMRPGYIRHIAEGMASGTYAYGSGRTVHIYGDNEHINTKHCPERKKLPPGIIPPSGTVQGSNMFFRRDVFDKLGLFREEMGTGSGTIFGWEDGEMVARAALAGFTGIMLPDAVIDHHQPKPWSEEMNEKHYGYELGRGNYHAYLLAQGVQQAWNLWALDWSDKKEPLNRRDLERLQREFHSAAEYIRYFLNETDN